MDKGVFGMRTAERDVRHALERLKTVEGFDKVRFIILYGSVAEGRARATSDVDLAVYYDGDHEEAARFRFAALSELADDRYDIQIFPICRSTSGRRSSADGSSTAPTSVSSTTSRIGRSGSSTTLNIDSTITSGKR